jgi:hypothetical protein
VNVSDNLKDTLLTTPKDKLDGLSTYIDGKMKRYSLLFAVNGGAFAIAKLLGDPAGQRVVGGLSLRALAVGAIIFSLLMWRDIYLFGEMMRNKFFGGTLVFEKGGKRILAVLSLLLISGWLLAAFWPTRM